VLTKTMLPSYLSNPVTMKPPVDINIDFSGLTYQEIMFIGALLNNQDTPYEGVSAWGIKQDLSKSGFNSIAFNISLRRLVEKGLIALEHESDYNGNNYVSINLTETGNSWVLGNADKFDTKVVREAYVEEKEDEGELPF